MSIVVEKAHVCDARGLRAQMGDEAFFGRLTAPSGSAGPRSRLLCRATKSASSGIERADVAGEQQLGWTGYPTLSSNPLWRFFNNLRMTLKFRRMLTGESWGCCRVS